MNNLDEFDMKIVESIKNGFAMRGLDAFREGLRDNIFQFRPELRRGTRDNCKVHSTEGQNLPLQVFNFNFRAWVILRHLQFPSLAC